MSEYVIREVRVPLRERLAVVRERARRAWSVARWHARLWWVRHNLLRHPLCWVGAHAWGPVRQSLIHPAVALKDCHRCGRRRWMPLQLPLVRLSRKPFAIGVPRG